MLIWGDSHAASLHPGLAAWRGPDGESLKLAQYTKARCPPLLVPPAEASARCVDMNTAVLDRIRRLRPGTVVLSGYWALYGEADTAGLATTIRRLQQLGVEHIVVLGQIPVWPRPLPRLLLEASRAQGGLPPGLRLQPGEISDRSDRRMQDLARREGADFHSPLASLCDAAGCLVTLPRDGLPRSLAFDESHLTLDGSMALADRLAPLLAAPRTTFNPNRTPP